MPHPSPATTLREVQQALARDHGFASWAALRQELEDRARSHAEHQAIADDPTTPPTAVREFYRSDRLLVRLAAYARDPGKVTPAAMLLTRLGGALTTLHVEPSTVGDATHQVDLPLASLAAGEYVVRIEARDGEAATAQLVPLRVRP